MLETAWLPMGPPMPDRFRLSFQAKRDTLVLQVGSWGVGLTPPNTVTETKAKNHGWTENLETVIGLRWQMRIGCWVEEARLIKIKYGGQRWRKKM